jgi:hydroxymethylbilane synthase
MIFATRPSALARWQTDHIISALRALWPDLTCESRVISTKGDRELDKPLPEIGGKGLFTFELERALLEGQVDAAVHSLKDLPTENTPGLTVGAIPERYDPRDVLVCPDGYVLDDLPRGARVGTSSTRRRAQLLAYRPDLKVISLRGNVDTRIKKAHTQEYDAIILAAAGIHRLGLEQHITQYLPVQIMLPAPGQGALAVQCRQEDESVLPYLAGLEDAQTRLAVEAERTLLDALGGGCSLPVGALASVDQGEINMQVMIASPDGGQSMRLAGVGNNPHQLGLELSQQALKQGAGDLISVALREEA